MLSNQTGPSLAINTAYDLSENMKSANTNDGLNINVKSGDKINYTNEDFKVSVNSGVEMNDTNDGLNINVNREDEINYTNEDFNVNVNSGAEVTYKNDQIGVNEEIDRDISSECKHNFKNNSGICE